MMGEGFRRQRRVPCQLLLGVAKDTSRIAFKSVSTPGASAAATSVEGASSVGSGCFMAVVTSVGGTFAGEKGKTVTFTNAPPVTPPSTTAENKEANMLAACKPANSRLFLVHTSLLRCADEWNPSGYYERQRLKSELLFQLRCRQL
jgi:hypothetical protein